MSQQNLVARWLPFRRLVTGHVVIGLLGGLSIGCGGDLAQPIDSDDKSSAAPATSLPPSAPNASNTSSAPSLINQGSPSNGAPANASQENGPKDWSAIARNNNLSREAEMLAEVERFGADPNANRKEYLVRKAATLSMLSMAFNQNRRGPESLGAAREASDLAQEFQKLEGSVTFAPPGAPFGIPDTDVVRNVAIGFVAASFNFGSADDQSLAIQRAIGVVGPDQLFTALPWLKDKIQDPTLLAMIEKAEGTSLAEVAESLGGEKFTLNFPAMNTAGDEFLISDYQGKYVIVLVSRDGKLPVTAGVGVATLKESLGDSVNLVLVDVEDAGRKTDFGFNIVTEMLPTLYADKSFLEPLPADLSLPAVVLVDKEGNGRIAVPMDKVAQLLSAIKSDENSN